ncbi:hypothetical protein H0H93_000722 [Arthromyces matolae]|nr:hypothetical protein H0H93_000722 [Arthromyces matolae]
MGSRNREPVTPGPRLLRTRPDPAPPLSKTRRTSEQVKKDQSAKEKAKKDKIAARNTMIDTIAHLESSLLEEEARLQAQAHHPPPSTQTKISRPKPRLINSQADDGRKAMPEHADNRTLISDCVIDPALLGDQPNLVEKDNEMILASSDDDEPSMSMQATQTSSDNVSVRAQVNASRHVSTTEEDSARHKRNASSTSDQTNAAPKKKMKKRNGGLRDNWNESPTPSNTHSILESTHRRSASLSSRSSRNLGQPLEFKGTATSTRQPQAVTSRDSDDESIGGLSDEASGEKAEREQIDNKPMRVGTQVKSLATVVQTSSVPDFVPGISAKVLNKRHLVMNGLKKKKADIRITDLRDSVRLNWDSTFKPRVIEYLGTLTPWQPFTEDDAAAIQDLWAACFPQEPRMESDQGLSLVVNKLLDDIVSSWQHKFSSTANQFLTSVIFGSSDLSTSEARRMWVEWALGQDPQVTEEELADAPEHGRRFYYREYEDAEEPGMPAISKGIFQSPIIVATLASHFQWLERIPSSERGEEFPVGALVLTIQACRHHMYQWQTGSLVTPYGSLAKFSASNWGDRQDRDGHSGRKNVNLTSDIMAAVDEVTAGQWKRIKAAVTEYLERQQRPATKRSVRPTLAATSSESVGGPSKRRFKLRDYDDVGSDIGENDGGEA